MGIYTIGHSTRTLQELRALLDAHGIQVLVDVRRFPASRRHPQFNGEALQQTLSHYVWAPALGGRRRPRQDTPHTAWRVAAFAAYADHMDTDEFVEGIRHVLTLARAERVALMCAEARPEQCHRRLIADWLVANGVEVRHILSPTRAERHELVPFARVEEGRVIYDGGQPSLPDE